MKKCLLITLFVLLAISGSSMAANAQSSSNEYIVGFDLPNFGWVQYNEQGEITGYKGFNLAVGYSQKTYFEPGIKMNKMNKYWGWGTVGLILPYAEVGFDYAIPLEQNDDFINVGAGLGVAFPLVPYPEVHVSYVF